MANGFDFSPLSESEREAATQELACGESDGTKPTCPPADVEAAEIAAARLFGSPPDMAWRYASADGEPAFFICRWNKPNGDKDIRPLSWFPDEGWRLAHWPDARPLYNLDSIASQPDAPIVVCEGEKAADAAARIFPKSISTTSSGGSQAAPKTDWTPLAGRQVLVWPDSDEAGAKYARDVAAALAALDCTVLIIDATALASIDPTVGTRDAAKGYDAADAIADWPDAGALRKTAVNHAKPFVAGPAYVSCPPYSMGTNGLTIEVERGRGGTKQTELQWIAAPFEVLGACRDSHGGGWGKVLQWRDDDGRLHVRHVADAELHGEPATLCQRLADGGLRIARVRQKEFANYLSAAPIKTRVTSVSRTGWHAIGNRSVFVLPAETVGPRGGESVILDAAAQPAYEARGSLADWREGPAKLARGHVLPVLAISAALAGPLLSLAGMDGGGLNFHGHSSKGKTTLLQLAASVWGRGGTGGFVRAWRATANGLEGAAAGATDTALILDELGQIDGRELAGALYALANGTGKARAGRNGDLREPKSWRVLIVSSGELSVDAKLSEDRGRRARAGQIIRMLDIPASRAHGVFDSAGPDGNAAAFANRCKQAAMSAYGTAGPEFVRHILAEKVTGDDVRASVKDFVVTHVSSGSDGQIDRAAQRFGLIAFAGELATAFGLTPWSKDEARKAAAWALGQWIEGRGGTEPAEARQAIERVRLFIEAHGEARFDSLDDPDGRPVSNRAGWRKGAGRDRRWLILPEVWKSEVCSGLDFRFVASLLADCGMLAKGNDGNTKVENIAGTSKRVYCVTPRIFAGSDE